MSRVPEKPSKLLTALVVQPAGIDDLADIRQLLSSAFKTLTSTSCDVAEAKRIQDMLDSPGFIDVLRGRALTIARLHHSPVAVGGWFPGPEGGCAAQLGTVAVAPLFVNLGLGRFIVEQVEDSARRAGFRSLLVHAPIHLVGFYRRLDYVTATSLTQNSTAGPLLRAKRGHATQLQKALVVAGPPLGKEPVDARHPSPRVVVTSERADSQTGHTDHPGVDLMHKRMPSRATH